jgi:hypothetical protein
VCVLLIDDDEDEGHCSSMVLASVFACSSIACALLVHCSDDALALLDWSDAHGQHSHHPSESQQPQNFAHGQPIEGKNSPKIPQQPVICTLWCTLAKTKNLKVIKY